MNELALAQETDLTEQFESIRLSTGSFPWMTEFEINSSKYGGVHSYSDDPRVRDFLGWTPPSHLSNILELGSCEGGQTLKIASDPRVNHIIALDGKPWLTKRAKLVSHLVSPNLASKIHFSTCNLDTDNLFGYGTFDSVFCSGILYHLVEPWKLLKTLFSLSNYLYLATHYTNKPYTTLYNGYRGILVNEPSNQDAWSGIAPQVFWFTLPELIRCLTELGWNIILLRNWPSWDTPSDIHPMVGMLCKKA
jgi:hypothetical protein